MHSSVHLTSTVSEPISRSRPPQFGKPPLTLNVEPDDDEYPDILKDSPKRGMRKQTYTQNTVPEYYDDSSSDPSILDDATADKAYKQLKGKIIRGNPNLQTGLFPTASTVGVAKPTTVT